MRQIAESIQLPVELESRIANLAELEGISIEQWVLGAVAAKAETAEFFLSRKKDSTGTELLDFLHSVPYNPPLPGDELPEGYIPHRLK